jgi:hypothetical protein
MGVIGKKGLSLSVLTVHREDVAVLTGSKAMALGGQTQSRTRITKVIDIVRGVKVR